MKNVSAYSTYLPGLLAGIFIGIGLYLSSLYNFLLFHTIAEFASIAVAYELFMIAWNSREFNENRYIVFLGIAYLFVGSLDFVHTLAYKGMNIFPGDDANLPTQLWIAARYLESLSLLFAVVFLQRRLKSEQVFGVYSAIFVILLFITLNDIFPMCYREGIGLTQFKIVSEYIISCILLAGLGLLYRKRAVFAPTLFKLMAASILFTICSELTFTFYVSVYGLSNLVGHYFKLLSFYLIYKVVIETSLREPYTVLFRNLQESRAMLQEREERFRRLTENAPEIIFRYNLRPEPHFDYVSSAATSIIGYTPEEHYADPQLGLKLIHPEDQERFQRYLTKLLERQIDQPEIIELRWIHKDGRLICTEQHITPVHDAAGNLIAIEGIARDISDRKRVEEALRESEQRLQLSLAGSGLSFWEWFPEDGTIGFDQRWADILGYEPGEKEFNFRWWEEAIHPDSRPVFEKALNGYLAGRKPRYELEYQIQTKTGEWKWVWAAGECVEYTYDGKPKRFLGTHRDITDYKQTETQLRISLEKYHVLFKAFPIGISVTDSQGKIVEANRESERLLGVSVQEHTYRKFDGPEWRILRPDGSPMPSDEYASVRALKEQRLIENVEMGIVKGEGEITWINVHAIPIPLEGYGVLITYHDITDRKQTEEALRKNEERYRKAQKLGRVGNWEYNIQTTEFWGSEEAKRIYGFDPASTSFSTEEVENCIPERVRVHQALVDLLEKDQEYNLEFDILTHDAQERKAIVSLAELERDAQGRPLKVTGVIQDTTERKRAQKLLETERQRFFSVLELIPAFVYLQAKDYSIAFVNHTFRELFGDPGNSPCYTTLHGRSTPCEECPTFTVFQTKQPVTWEWTSKMGQTYMICDNLFLDTNGAEMVLEIGIDITERKQAAEQVKAALKEKEVLLREIHHRVKNNLMVVQALIEMQAHQTTQPEALDLFRDLHNRVMAMAMVHENLYQSQNLAQIDFERYLERLLINIRQGFAKTRATIKVAAKEIFLDVEQAIPCGLITAELATNAFKYAFRSSPLAQPSPLASLPEGEGSTSLPLAGEDWGEGFVRGESAEIRVEMRKDDKVYTLIVSDNGAGLPSEFDWRKTETLGLILVHSWAVHQLKGTIEVDNQPGATFRIVFSAEQ